MQKIFIIIVTLISTGPSAEVMALRNIDLGDPYPSFCALQLNGEQICSSKYKDTIFIASFVSLDQKESLKTMSVLQDLHTRYSTRNVSIVSIAPGEVDQQELVAVSDKNKITYPLFLDRNREIYGRVGVIVYPTIAVFDWDGTLRYLFSSSTINIGKRLEGCIRFLSGEIEVDELEKIMHPVVEKIGPERAKVDRYYKFAQKSFAKQQFSTAKKIVVSTLKDYPEHAFLYSLLGYILIEEEDYTLGLKQFELALKFDHNLEEAITGKQICLENINR